MKKLGLVAIVFLFVLTLSACSDICVGTACISGETEEPDDQVEVDCEVTPDDPACEITDPGTDVPQLDSILYYDHLNGHGTETIDHVAYLLFEEEMLGYVKYQVSYLSCTCRNSDVNYWQVMYIEIKTTDNSIQRISFGQDKEEGSHTYTAGMWGDSSPTPGPSGDYSDGKYLEDFETEFIPWLIGQTPESLDGITVFTNEPYHGIENTQTINDPDGLIDSYAGSSVSTNNMLRILQTMFEYHLENYS
jgi:hypothetical protein